MIFTQNGNELQSHKEIIYAFVSKDKRFLVNIKKNSREIYHFILA
ncbi:hypothetical protein UNSW1_1126 [Campylobacter concisus UNSW1]|nr:hypothetical protein UNSW1_1126 [Campylobacter concisus UNSW1]